jgi:hypothetical protein
MKDIKLGQSEIGIANRQTQSEIGNPSPNPQIPTPTPPRITKKAASGEAAF